MKHLILAVLLCLPTIATAQDVPPGVVRIYIYIDNDHTPDIFGSGALVSPTQVLTNWHVVESRRNDPPSRNMSVQVRFHDGTRSYAAVIQQDRTWDLALLKIHPVDFQPFTIGANPEAGNILTAHGLGFDYEYKAKVGIVAAGDRHPPGFCPDDKGIIEITTGRSARQGDSGGPMTNHLGQLVAVLNATGNKLILGITVERARKVFGDKFKPSRQSNDGSVYIFKESQ